MMKLSQWLLIGVVVLSTVACGKIPSAYQGDFVDAAQGAKVSLGGDSGTLSTSDGRALEAKANDLNFDNLQEGKVGIYLSQNSANGNLTDVYWIAPNMATKQEAAGLVWFSSEVMYTIMDSKREDKVASIEFFHCKDGMVMLDTSTKRFQLGCPAGPLHYNMVRAK